MGEERHSQTGEGGKPREKGKKIWTKRPKTPASGQTYPDRQTSKPETDERKALKAWPDEEKLLTPFRPYKVSKEEGSEMAKQTLSGEKNEAGRQTGANGAHQ